jgi:hypothetical protein
LRRGAEKNEIAVWTCQGQRVFLKKRKKSMREMLGDAEKRELCGS